MKRCRGHITLVLPLLLILLAGSTNFIHAQPTAVSTPTLLITELMPHPTHGGTEWVEIAYWGDTPLDLSEYKIGDEETLGGGEGMMRFPAGTEIAPGQIMLIAQDPAAFQLRYGFPPDFAWDENDTAVSTLLRASDLATGSFNLANSGDEVLILGPDNELVDALSYGTSTHFFDPAVPAPFAGQTLARHNPPCDNDTAVDWIATRPTPGQLPDPQPCQPPLDLSGQTRLSISQIQGAGAVSPVVNQNVTVTGTVIGQHISRNSSGTIYHTWFIQDEGDGNPATSDGLPIFFGREQPDLQPGDVIEVTGRVIEFFGLTEISDRDLTWAKIDTAVPPAPLELTADHLLDLESLEGMLVTLPEAVVMGATHAGCGFAVALPDQSERLLRHTIDTDVSAILPVLFQTNVDCSAWPQLKTGDQLRNVTGPLTYHFDQYKIVLQDPSTLEVIPAPWPAFPSVPELGAGEISVASFNLFNHFDSVDDTGLDSEPKPTAVEIALKEQKIAHAIQGVLGCPTLIGIQEVENEALLLSLAETTEPLCGFRYEVSHLESDDARGIDVALLSDPRRAFITAVSLQRACTTLDTGLPRGLCPAGETRLFSRPPIEVKLLLDSQPFVIYVNHFKSKLGGEEETTPRRIAQAAHQRELVTAVLTAQPDTHVIVIGDFNDYADSEPMQIFTTEGVGQLENVLRRLPPAEQYSYIYAGVSQLIDGLLFTPHTAVHVTDVRIQHVNADFPASLAQNLAPEFLLYGNSDHDLPLVVLSLAGEEINLPTPVSATPEAEPEPTAVSPTAIPTPSPIPATAPADNIIRNLALFATALILFGTLAGLYLWRKQ